MDSNTFISCIKKAYYSIAELFGYEPRLTDSQDCESTDWNSGRRQRVKTIFWRAIALNSYTEKENF